MESWVQSWRPRTNAFFSMFHFTCLKYCACHEIWCQVVRSAAPVTQNHLSKPEDLMLQNATPLRKSATGPPNSSDEHVSCIAPATENASLQILFKCPTPAIVFENATKPSRFAHFWQGAQSVVPATQNDIPTSKSAPYPSFFPLLTSKCASRHNGVHFFDITTSKSAPELKCFVHFDLEMCFYSTCHINIAFGLVQKWSKLQVMAITLCET